VTVHGVFPSSISVTAAGMRAIVLGATAVSPFLDHVSTTSVSGSPIAQARRMFARAVGSARPAGCETGTAGLMEPPSRRWLRPLAQRPVIGSGEAVAYCEAASTGPCARSSGEISGGKSPSKVSSSGEVGGRCDQHQAASEGLQAAWRSQCKQQRPSRAHRRADHDLRPATEKTRTPRRSLPAKRLMVSREFSADSPWTESSKRTRRGR